MYYLDPKEFTPEHHQMDTDYRHDVTNLDNDKRFKLSPGFKKIFVREVTAVRPNEEYSFSRRR